MTAEHDRLEETRGGAPLEEVGPVPQRAAVGTVREDYSEGGDCLELFHARPRALPGPPLRRGGPGGDLRRPATALLRPGRVEREGPGPEGSGCLG